MPHSSPPALPHVPPPSSLGHVAIGKGKTGRSPAKAGTGRTAAGTAESDIRVFCTVFTGHVWSFTAVFIQTLSPPLAHESLSQLHSSWPPVPAALSLLSWLGQPLFSPSSPLYPRCLFCLFWTQTLSLKEPHRAWQNGVPFQALL